MDRKVTATEPNQLWVADITDVPTVAGFLNLPVVLDAWSRKIVGWLMANHPRNERVIGHRWRWRLGNADQRTSFIIAIRAANIRPWRSANAAVKLACGHR